MADKKPTATEEQGAKRSKKAPHTPAVQHLMGKDTGYNLFPDGSYSLAPMHAKRIDDITMDEAAVRALLGHVTDHCARLLKRSATAKLEWFRAVADDLGIDMEEFDLTWDGGTQRLVKQRKPREVADA